MIENSLELFHRQAARFASPRGVLDSYQRNRITFGRWHDSGPLCIVVQLRQ